MVKKKVVPYSNMAIFAKGTKSKKLPSGRSRSKGVDMNLWSPNVAKRVKAASKKNSMKKKKR